MRGGYLRGWAALLLGLAACSTTAYQAKFHKSEDTSLIDERAPFLKCHMHDGSVYVLERWHVDVPGDEVRGTGFLYNSTRLQIAAGEMHVRLSEVALLETNRPESVPRDGLIVMAVVTGASLVVSAICLTNPKSCFGSCPTFYASDGQHEVLQAEGFSSSVARAFEATDVDALWVAHASGSTFDVRMTNEALETHVVDRVCLLALPRPSGGRVLRAGETYYPATRLLAPRACEAPQGSCLAEVLATDEREYLSRASESDLAERETLDLTFPRGRGKVGLMIAARNSLLNTFVFYQGLAYMGTRAGDWFARLDDAGGEAARLSGFGALLGDIDVSVETADGWIQAGSFSEVGPIAREVQLVPLPEPAVTGGDVHVRLSLARGNWKLDQLALAEIGSPLTPTVIDPVRVTRSGRPAPDALAKLLDPGAHLVTYPGDVYTLSFDVPAGDPELFLESRGYYYEWMREDWLREENALEVARMIVDPAGAMRRWAPKYKRIEGDMERVFWQSRFGARR